VSAAIKNHRFVICQPDYIVDKLNPTNNDKVHFFEGDPDDDMHLRECVLRRCLSDLVHDLITNNNPTAKNINRRAGKASAFGGCCLRRSEHPT
jgi:hypothetical protein